MMFQLVITIDNDKYINAKLFEISYNLPIFINIYQTIHMKYQQGKIKKEHHSLKEFADTFNRIAAIKEVQRIIPGRISRQQKWTGNKHINFSYTTHSWLKLTMKKWWTAQEVFVICKQEDTASLLEHMYVLDIVERK